jgi:hypothetical protein
MESSPTSNPRPRKDFRIGTIVIVALIIGLFSGSVVGATLFNASGQSGLSTDSYEQKRVTLTPAFDQITYIGPPAGYYWVVDSIQIELHCDAHWGNRLVYVYFMDQYMNATRFLAITGYSSYNYRAIMTPSTGLSTITIYGEQTWEYPLYSVIVDDQSAYGFWRTNSYGADDVFNVHLFVREYVK